MLFFFFPVRTDAPIYHFPYATIGLIVLNAAVFVLTFVMPLMFGIGDYEAWVDELCVTLGGAVQPIAWLSANLYHFDLGHFFFNMFFLWTFGILVEGKVGAGKFLAICFVIGTPGYAIIQGTFYGIEAPTWAGGASVVISGLMLISLLWAPRNDIGLAYFLWVLFYIRLGVWDIAVSSFIMLYLFLQAVSAVIQGTFLTSEFMHLVGAAAGALVGFAMLRARWVDCEGWDLFAVMRGESGRQLKRAIYDEIDPSLGPGNAVKNKIKKKKQRAIERREAADESDAAQNMSPNERALAKIHQLLKQKKAQAALQLLLERQRIDPKFQMPGPDLLRLAQQLHKLNKVDAAVRFLLEYLERFPEGSDRVRLRAASLMLAEQSRPSAALRVMQPIVGPTLSDEERNQFQELTRQANAMIAEGVIELGDGAW